MASSKEAFDKFAIWRSSRTVLKLTVLTNDEIPNVFRGEISWFDAEARVVSFAVSATRDFTSLDLNGANFRVGKRAVEATHRIGSVVFEEE
jgi:hypothetical protein